MRSQFETWVAEPFRATSFGKPRQAKGKQYRTHGLRNRFGTHWLRNLCENTEISIQVRPQRSRSQFRTHGWRNWHYDWVFSPGFRSRRGPKRLRNPCVPFFKGGSLGFCGPKPLRNLCVLHWLRNQFRTRGLRSRVETWVAPPFRAITFGKPWHRSDAHRAQDPWLRYGFRRGRCAPEGRRCVRRGGRSSQRKPNGCPFGHGKLCVPDAKQF